MAQDEKAVKAEVVVKQYGLPAAADVWAAASQLLDIGAVETWDFQTEGDVAGLVIAKAYRTHEEFGDYPYLTLQLQDGGMRGVAMIGILRALGERAEDGDLIAIRYLGDEVSKNNRTFHNYSQVHLPKNKHGLTFQAEKPF